MLLRLFFLLTLIAVAVSLGIYLITRDKRYLRYTLQIIKFAGVLFLVAAVLWTLGRIILF